MKADEIKKEIARLTAELESIAPIEAMSVRAIAKRAGISTATAHRFKSGKTMDVPTVRRLISAGLVSVCPCCGASKEASNAG